MWLALQGKTSNQGLFCNNWKLRERLEARKKKEARFLLIYHAIIALRSLTYTVSASLDMQLHWTFPGWGPSKPCIKIHLSIILQHHEKQSTAPASMKWSYNLLLKKKKTVLWTSRLCAKRCFRSEGGHTARTNTNARAAFPLQKEGIYNTVHQSTNTSCLVFGKANSCFCKHLLDT